MNLFIAIIYLSFTRKTNGFILISIDTKLLKKVEEKQLNLDW